MTGHSTRILVSMALVASLASAARATSRDYIDETLVSQEFKAREVGIEFAAESRLDRDYRLQGWYTGELETAATRRWFVEAMLSGLDRGQGLELAAWRFGTRYRVVGRDMQFDLALRNLADVRYRDYLSRYKEFALNQGRNVMFRVSTGL